MARRRKHAYRRGVTAASIRHVRALVRKGDCFAAEAYLRNYPLDARSATLRRLGRMVARCKYVPPPARWLPPAVWK